jgi:hypothetical protein
MAEQDKSNPEVFNYSPKDSMLIKQFERLTLIKDGGFLEKRFKSRTTQKTVFTDSSKRNFPITFFYDSLTKTTHFKVFFLRDSIDVNTKNQPFFLQPLNYAFLDVIPGGNKELVLLYQYYIMNGYNYDLNVYQIETE